MIAHGGSGSVIGALAHGLPTVLLPLGADQPHNAGQCVRLGVGRELDPIAVTPLDVRAAVAEVLADSSYRRAAEQVRAEMLELPDPRTGGAAAGAVDHFGGRCPRLTTVVTHPSWNRAGRSSARRRPPTAG
ncbi:UDP:flavonoid glycosyltransferase YjiC (YdhE family) [Saccharothrix ecbatanensis]|uniref:UDP:flavonoid glycosyltransferase YjiC (YdhE family) n=1 Tax=Saccharothrix ecbatanensis TaxID=1105145 RepID=A0A7W9HKD4_9PSEU|nr:UDP:flavonoid glycosyltransferase YjiC (YdhE family) [Saccharothrix ecbatanensis]